MDTSEPLHDEPDEPPEVGDPLAAACAPLIEAIVEATEAGSPQRKAAMNVVLELPARIRAAISRPRLN
jgi:hypothetical protein